MEGVTVACVLRSGGVYDMQWVNALERQVAEHIPEADFALLHDEHKWPGWWAKLGLFEPGRFSGPVLYLDLDTLIVDDLPDLEIPDGVTLLSDFYVPHQGQSGVMAFRPGERTDHVWQMWTKDIGRNMYRCRGDGEFLHWALGDDCPRIQDQWPGVFVSFKVDALAGPPDGASVVCGHGKLKFNSPAAGWAHEYWKSYL